MVRIRRFSVIRTANTVALMYVITIAILAVPFLLIFLVAAPTQQSGSGPNISVAVAPILALILIVFYGLLGWVFTALACLVYNLTSRFTGGVGMELLTEWVPAVPPTAPVASPGASGSTQPPAQP